MRGIYKTVLVVIVALAMPVIPFVVIGELPGERWLSASDDNAMLFALTGSGLLVVDVLLPVPSSIVIALMGSRLGFIVGWLGAWIGLTIGNMLGYAVGRLWPQKISPEVPEAPSLIVLFISRPVPILAEAAAIAAGASRLPVTHVLLVCVAGNFIYTGVLAAGGAALLSAQITFLWLFLPLLVPAAAWSAWRWLRGRKSAASQST